MRNWWAHQDSNLEPKDYETAIFSLLIKYLLPSIFPRTYPQVLMAHGGTHDFSHAGAL